MSNALPLGEQDILNVLRQQGQQTGDFRAYSLRLKRLIEAYFPLPVLVVSSKAT